MVLTCHCRMYAEVLAAAEPQGHDGWGCGAQVLGTVVNQLLQDEHRFQAELNRNDNFTTALNCEPTQLHTTLAVSHSCMRAAVSEQLPVCYSQCAEVSLLPAGVSGIIA
jgi:hypothetical protein